MFDGAHGHVADVADAFQKTASVYRAHVGCLCLGVVFRASFAPGHKDFEHGGDFVKSLRRQRDDEHGPGERVILI